MLKYNKNEAVQVSEVCCVSGKGNKKISYNSLAEAGTVANRLGSAVYQCRVTPGTYHITSQKKSTLGIKIDGDRIKEVKSVKRRNERELNARLDMVENQLEELYEQEKLIGAWTQEQLDEFYRREQELLNQECILVEELEDEDCWMWAMKSKS